MPKLRPDWETARLKLKAESILKRRKKAGLPLMIRETARITGLGAETVAAIAERLWPGTRKPVRANPTGLSADDRDAFSDAYIRLVEARIAEVRRWKMETGGEQVYPAFIDLDERVPDPQKLLGDRPDSYYLDPCHFKAGRASDPREAQALQAC